MEFPLQFFVLTANILLSADQFWWSVVSGIDEWRLTIGVASTHQKYTFIISMSVVEHKLLFGDWRQFSNLLVAKKLSPSMTGDSSSSTIFIIVPLTHGVRWSYGSLKYQNMLHPITQLVWIDLDKNSGTVQCWLLYTVMCGELDN